MSLWYTYDQSKIRGVYMGPARTVIVQAATPQEADARAEAAGVDFHADSYQCCGTRFMRMAEHVWCAEPVPTYGGRPVRVEASDAAVPSSSTELGDEHLRIALMIADDGAVTYGPMKSAT
jgi:hypothetical protein